MLEAELVGLVNQIAQVKSESSYLEIKAGREGCPKLFDTLSFSGSMSKAALRFAECTTPPTYRKG